MSVPVKLVAALALSLTPACTAPAASTHRVAATAAVEVGVGRVVPEHEPTPPGALLVEPHPALVRAGAPPLRVLPYALEVTGARRARGDRDPARVWVLVTPLSSRLVGLVSGECIGERFAFLLDGQYLSAPIVAEPLGPSRQLDVLLRGYTADEVTAIVHRFEALAHAP